MCLGDSAGVRFPFTYTVRCKSKNTGEYGESIGLTFGFGSRFMTFTLIRTWHWTVQSQGIKIHSGMAVKVALGQGKYTLRQLAEQYLG